VSDEVTYMDVPPSKLAAYLRHLATVYDQPVGGERWASFAEMLRTNADELDEIGGWK
jgi:hypothetical protein